MKQFEYSKKSLHFRLADKYGNLCTEADWHYDENGNCTGYEQYYDGDLCTYIQHMVKGVFNIVFFSALSLVAFVPMTLALVYIFVGLTTGTWFELGEDDNAIGVGLAIWCVFIALGIFVSGMFGYHKYREAHPIPVKEEKAPKQPGFASIAYAKFKDKTCARLLVK